MISVGVLGAGSVVRSLHLPVLRAFSGVRVRWICDADLERAKSAARVADVEDVCSSLEDHPREVDVVLVAIPVGARRPALATIASRKEHAFCEKPFAASLEDHEWMISRARAGGIHLGVALVRRVYGSTDLARRLLASGVLGAVESVSAGEGARIQRTGREGEWYQADPEASGGGVLMETGPHLVDQVMTICDVRSFSIESCVQTTSGGLEFETVAKGTLELRSGRMARFRMDVTRLRDVYNGIVIRCEHGELRVGLGVDSGVQIAGRSGGPAVRLEAPGPRDAHSAFAEEWRRFLARSESPADGAEDDTGLLTTAFIDACYRFGRASEPGVTR